MKKKEVNKILKEYPELKLVCGVILGERANLSGADLSGANLIDAFLKGANLSGAHLAFANLIGSDLSDANLAFANLSGANLIFSNLRGANLSGANLSGANLSFADLRGADLKGTDLNNTNLCNAQLDKKEKYRLGVILDKPITGYKKCCDGVIVKLKIPKGAIVFSINGKKCRTNIAKCISISNKQKQATSSYSDDFTYKIGKTYTIKDFNLMYNVECGSGIHFFKTIKEAKEYQL